MWQPAGDTHPTRALNELAAGTDVHIQQIMGPLPAFESLSFESQYLLNVPVLCPCLCPMNIALSAARMSAGWVLNALLA